MSNITRSQNKSEGVQTLTQLEKAQGALLWEIHALLQLAIKGHVSIHETVKHLEMIEKMEASK